MSAGGSVGAVAQRARRSASRRGRHEVRDDPHGAAAQRARRPASPSARGRLRLGAALTVWALAASGCGRDSTSAAGAGSGAPTILVTTGIWADVVSHVACDGSAVIETIIPPGGDPHSFEPSLQGRGRMEGAALVVANGLELEERLEDTLEAVEASGTPVFEMAANMSTVPLSLAAGEHRGEGGEDKEGMDDIEDAEGRAGHGSGGDPHVWFDPGRVSGALPELARRLSADAGLDAAAVDECLADYQSELAAVDAEIAEKVARLPAESRKLVTNHSSLAYFADRYGFEVVGTVIDSSSTMAQTNPAQLEELAEMIEHEGVKAIFSETLHSKDAADALASRVGEVEVVTLYTGSLGPAGSGADTYIGFMRTNAALIVDSLG